MFQSKLSLVAGACSVLVAIVLIVMQLSISTSINSSVSDSMSSYDTGGAYVGGGSQKDSLDPTRIAAPKGGTGQLGEFVIVDEALPVTEIIIDDGTKDIDFEPKIVEEVVPTLSQDAGVVEKATFYLGIIWAWILGDRGDDDGYEMSCKPKKGGGKVCTIDR
jgi:hypothetical protein